MLTIREAFDHIMLISIVVYGLYSINYYVYNIVTYFI